jgi:hypothetical protein
MIAAACWRGRRAWKYPGKKCRASPGKYPQDIFSPTTSSIRMMIIILMYTRLEAADGQTSKNAVRVFFNHENDDHHSLRHFA